MEKTYLSKKDIKELREKLAIYRALDNDDRLNILFTIAKEPGISFNDISRKTGIEKPLLAYHLGLLKVVGLVEMRYQKRSKKSTMYNLTDKGKEIIEKLKEISQTR